MRINNDIAIIGMSGRFPDAKNVSEFYNNLKEGKDSIKDISPQRIRDTNLPQGRKYLRCGYLEDVDKFDYELFNLTLGEAENMGLGQRLLLEVAYEVFEDSGYGADYFSGSNTAVFTVEKDSNYYQPAEQFTPIVITGNLPPYLAARIARQFNLHGNTAVIDTTCSSALVALHLACNELLLGNCDYAFVGGVNINLFPVPESPHNMVLNNLGLLSIDGKSRAFSDEASGMSCGEVVAGVLLKPLKKAIQDDDVIHAVIKSTAVNNNAKRSASITAPDSVMQAELTKEAWTKAGVDPELLSYIEVHGSGVKLSDGLEVEGLNLAFQEYTDKKMICPISTVKSNIGHCKNASGMPALIKTILTLKYGVIFPAVNYGKPSRIIDFNNSAVYVNKNLVEIKSKKNEIKYAGVTSLGTSGTNCHVVLASWPARKLIQAPELPGYQFKESKCKIKILANTNIDYFENIEKAEKEPPCPLEEKGNEIEEKIAFFWRDALRIDRFSLKDDFFELGGDSLKAAGIINKINRVFDINLSFEDLYDYPNIGSLGKYISGLWGTRQKIFTIWKEVLKLEKIDFEDDFFKLGGHSLLATQVIKKIEEIFKIRLTFDEIYQYPVLSSLSDFLDKQISRFDGSKRVMSGGVPMTEIEGWLLKNDISPEKKIIKIPCPNIDSCLLLHTISEFPGIYPDLNLNLLIKGKNGKWSKKNASQGILKEEFNISDDYENISNFKKEIQGLWNLDKKELCLAIISRKKVLNIVFFLDSRAIAREVFVDFLKNFQHIYNLKLAGKKINKNSLNYTNKYLYTPKYSYPPYYGCRDSCALERIRRENDSLFYNSLLPAESLACLPNYYKFNNKIIWCSIYNSALLGYKDVFNSLGIKFKYLNFKGKNEAEKYYTRSIEKNNILILIGSSYDLPFSRYYQDKEFIAAGRERRNFNRINISLFSGSLKDGPVIYSPNFNYFGEISQNDFWIYWSRQNTIKEKEFNKYIENVFLETLETFQVLDIQNIESIRPHSIDMLYKALKQNVKEFYKNNIIKHDNTRGFSKVYFGKQVIQIFKKDILGSLNRNRGALADILLLDLTKRLQMSYLFLRDLLSDVYYNDNNFKPELNGVLQIIDEWDLIYSKLLSSASRNQINFMSKISILPSFDLYEHEFLSKKDKNELIRAINKISDIQDNVFYSLSGKLKKLL